MAPAKPLSLKPLDASRATGAFSVAAVAPAAPPIAPPVARAPDPLPAAIDAYRGIRLACLADDLPPMIRTDRASAVRVGPYTLQPAVRVHEDGSLSAIQVYA